MAAPLRHIALRYMTEFRCIGPDCEDTCCTGWSVDVDESHYKKIKKAVSSDASMRELFDRAFKLREPATRSRQNYALMVLGERFDCPFLDGDRMCGIHKRFGERLLPDVCAIYPRAIGVVGRRAELTGELSCPEVARRALLCEDATDLLEVSPSVMGRGTPRQSLDPERGSPYERHLDDVRGAFYELMTLGQYPLASRLFFASCFAERVHEFFHASAQSVDEQRLQFELGCLGRTDILDEMHGQFRGHPVDGALPMSVIAKVLSRQLELDCHPPFRELVRKALAGYLGEGVRAASDDSLRMTVSPEALWAAYLARREVLTARVGERIELYFQNYCKNFWMRSWYVHAPDLIAHVRQLLLRVASLRFLLFSQPETMAAAELADPAERQRALDRIAVAVVHAFSRTQEHSTQFLYIMAKSLEELLPSLTYSVSLLKF
jgi:lysine-N-methylase